MKVTNTQLSVADDGANWQGITKQSLPYGQPQKGAKVRKRMTIGFSSISASKEEKPRK
jgi:hypothetical protein